MPAIQQTREADFTLLRLPYDYSRALALCRRLDLRIHLYDIRFAFYRDPMTLSAAFSFALFISIVFRGMIFVLVSLLVSLFIN